MAKQPKLRMTNADYVAIAVSPALIMALVGSLVFFLIEVLYVGQYHARLNYVFALFVFATVLIGRISIEMGAERAALFALPLGIAMFLVLAKFVEHASPYSHLINIALLGIVWWSTHKLTWDCTLIDDNEDASGEGLMQHLGVDELADEQDPQQNDVENELLAGNESAKKKAPHTPGLWVLYFSLAALPLFGLGQKWISPSEVGRRQYAFSLLAVYVAAGLALLVTTSFLGLRRYLRQRRIEMPTPMAATWVATGGVLIVVVMLLAALIPRPSAEYAISQVPWQASSPSDLASSRRNFGSDGTKDENADDGTRKVLNEETDPNATATREGDNPTTTTEEGKKQSPSEASQDKESQSKPSEQGKQSESESTNQDDQQNSEQSESSKNSNNEQTKSDQQQDDESTSDKQPAPAAENATQDSQPSNNSDSQSAAETSRPRPSLPNPLTMLGGLTGLLKTVLYAVIGLVFLYLAWQHREQIAAAIADFVQAIRDFLARLFGGAQAKPASVADDETVVAVGPPPRAFASFTDPFASGQHQTLPPDELVRYTFEAFTAWAREHGHPHSADQTPLELIQQAVPKQSPLHAESLKLARLYNEAAYAPKSVSTAGVEKLAKLWKLMRQTQQPPSSQTTSSQTPLEPVR